VVWEPAGSGQGIQTLNRTIKRGGNLLGVNGLSKWRSRIVRCPDGLPVNPVSSTTPLLFRHHRQQYPPGLRLHLTVVPLHLRPISGVVLGFGAIPIYEGQKECAWHRAVV